jgi:RNA polymerase sigma factor (sigma-70 family)
MQLEAIARTLAKKFSDRSVQVSLGWAAALELARTTIADTPNSREQGMPMIAATSMDSMSSHGLPVFPAEATCRTSRSMNRTADIFESHRRRLFGIAYRMLRTRADAEDVLQDAYLRWHQTTEHDIQSPTGFLITVTSRLCLDRLRHWKKEREHDAGSWDSQCVADDYVPSPEEQCETTDEVSAAFMAIFERLGPEARAAFLLREVFDCEYSEVARMLGKTEAACRQLIHRSYAHLRNVQARFRVTPQCRERVLKKSFAAIASGDRQSVLALLAEDVEYMADVNC